MDNKQRETNRLILFYFICQKAVFAGRWRCGKSSKIPSKNPLQNNPVTAARTTLSHWVDRSMEIPSMWTRKNIQNFVKGNGSETASNNVFKRVRLNGCQPRAQPTIHLSIWAIYLSRLPSRGWSEARSPSYFSPFIKMQRRLAGRNKWLPVGGNSCPQEDVYKNVVFQRKYHIGYSGYVVPDNINSFHQYVWQA